MFLLPNGSVVRLKDGEKKLMTIGILVKNSQTNQTFDYISCLYPEGFISPDNMYLFNNEDIEEVHYMGFSDAEEQLFRGRLANEVDQIEKFRNGEKE